MTMISAPRTPDFPDHPQDGFQIIEELPDGRKLIWTYNAELNQWNSQFVNPQDAATEGWVLEQGYLNGPLKTKDVLTTRPTEVKEADGTPRVLSTQEEVNNFVADVAETAVKAAGRTTDMVDFLQNSIGKGTWTHTFAGVGIPQASEFWIAGNVAEFADVTKIFVNDEGIAGQTTNDPGTLADTRVGDYLTIQERGSNDFGMYVVESVAIQKEDEQTVREFGLALYENRASGSSTVNSSRCQITTSRPMYVVVQDDAPKVSTRGVLWYREADDVLSISNYATGFTGNGPQWTEINGAGGGEGGGNYLPLSGGEVTGNLDVTGSFFTVDSYSKFKRTDASSASNYVVSVEAPLLDEGAQVAFRVNADGSVKAGHSNSLPFMAAAKNDVITKAYTDAHTLQPDKANDVTTGFRVKADGSTLISTSGNELGLYHVKDPTSGNAEWAATKGYVDGEIAKVGGGGGSFQDKYDGNRECIANGMSTTTLSSGQVMYLNNQLVSTTQPALVEAIGLPLDDFNWASCIKSGVIKVNKGAYEAGYYQVFKTKEMSGRNMLVYVKPIWFDSDQLLEEGGTPCYFQGVFFDVDEQAEILQARSRQLEAERKRARNPDGTFRADDPSTPGINEAWESE
jgi:hypothetical protein